MWFSFIKGRDYEGYGLRLYVVYSMSVGRTRKLNRYLGQCILLFDRYYPRCPRTLVINKLRICDPASAKEQFACKQLYPLLVKQLYSNQLKYIHNVS